MTGRGGRARRIPRLAKVEIWTWPKLADTLVGLLPPLDILVDEVGPMALAHDIVAVSWLTLLIQDLVGLDLLDLDLLGHPGQLTFWRFELFEKFGFP